MTTRQPAIKTLAYGTVALLWAACQPTAAGPIAGSSAPQNTAGAAVMGASGHAGSTQVMAGSGSTGSVSSPPSAGTAAATGSSGKSGSAGSVASTAGTSAPTAGVSGGTAGSAPPGKTTTTIFWLDITGNGVMRADETNFMGGQRIAATGTAPDGVNVDLAGGKLYWSCMGSLLGTGGGSIQRANIDGSMVETIVASPKAGTTPKQLQLDLVNHHVYWGDREGAKLWRADMDGKNPEILVSGHGLMEVVGVALDTTARKAYFTDRTGRKILRTNFDKPAGATDATRMDVEELFVLTGQATPIDLDLDLEHGFLYWTDRTLGTVHRGGIEIPSGKTAANRDDAKTLVSGLSETIGVSLDIPNNRMYFTELNGGVHQSALDGTGEKRITAAGSASGVNVVHLPAK